jgi:hypothetical protein
MDHMRGTMIFVDIPSFIFHRSFASTRRSDSADAASERRHHHADIVSPIEDAGLIVLKESIGTISFSYLFNNAALPEAMTASRHRPVHRQTSFS